MYTHWQGEGAGGAQRITYRELAGLVVDADVGNMHGVGWRGYGGPARGAQHAVHEAREGTLFLATVRFAVLGLGRGVGLVAVSLAWALGAAIGAGRGDCLHGGASEGSKARRLPQLRGFELGRLCGMRVLGLGTWRVVRGSRVVDVPVDGC